MVKMFDKKFRKDVMKSEAKKISMAQVGNFQINSAYFWRGFHLAVKILPESEQTGTNGSLQAIKQARSGLIPDLPERPSNEICDIVELMLEVLLCCRNSHVNRFISKLQAAGLMQWILSDFPRLACLSNSHWKVFKIAGSCRDSRPKSLLRDLVYNEKLRLHQFRFRGDSGARSPAKFSSLSHYLPCSSRQCHNYFDYASGDFKRVNLLFFVDRFI